MIDRACKNIVSNLFALSHGARQLTDEDLGFEGVPSLPVRVYNENSKVRKWALRTVGITTLVPNGVFLRGGTSRCGSAILVKQQQGTKPV